MPIIRVEMLAGRTPQQKEEYANELTKITSEVLNCSGDAVEIIFMEIKSENWARDGKLHGPATQT
ncbi:MAG: 4-oxalocrotonate tautomerase [Paraburkholderia sp.]|jgi:4-oxalocrotonate tautomerase|uniref:4-oxalocrotonate tautomerase n=1 Tax=Paraburkholderia sp. TaxID=1926495 RepID=UPI0039794B8D